MKRKCESCGGDRAEIVQWWTRGMGLQMATLCDVHRSELWTALEPLCKVNEAWLRFISLADMFAEWWLETCIGWAD